MIFMTYLIRLLKDIWVDGDIVSNTTMDAWFANVDVMWRYVSLRVKWGNYRWFSLSDILIKNIDKIAQKVRNEDDYDMIDMQEFCFNLCEAIQEEKLEEWAESLYNNK